MATLAAAAISRNFDAHKLPPSKFDYTFIRT
jgi:hypothetical protein